MTTTLHDGTIIKIDKADLALVNKYRWHGMQYVMTQVKGKTAYLHRLIMGAPSKVEVDHINGDKLDNRRCNLRLATSSQNKSNIPIISSNTSGFKGVSLHKRTNRFATYIQTNGKKNHFGYFDTKEEAAHVYNQVAEQIFGPFAYLNKIGDN